MQLFLTDLYTNDEIIRKNWPNHSDDSLEKLDDSDWEILNENNHQDILKRHWFKQNYINYANESITMVIHH